MNAKPLGFNLLDLLIALAVIGVLAILGVPQYQGAIQQARRAEAKAELMRLAQLQAKWRAAHASYAPLNALGGAATQENYQFSVTLNTATAFIISATPIATSAQAQDICATLSINQDTQISSSNLAACPKP